MSVLRYYGNLEPKFKELYDLCPPDHGWGHITDVVKDAQFICDSLCIPYTREIELGAVLHDIGNMKERERHNVIGAMMVPRVLQELNISQNEVDYDLVANCVRHHRASNPFVPETIEERIVSSADRGRPATTRDKVLSEVLLRSVVYNLTHGNHKNPVESALNWMKETYVIKETGIYPPEFQLVFNEALEKQKQIIDSLTLEECEKYIEEMGVFQPIKIV